jgi:hypothetical protein
MNGSLALEAGNMIHCNVGVNAVIATGPKAKAAALSDRRLGGDRC